MLYTHFRVQSPGISTGGADLLSCHCLQGKLELRDVEWPALVFTAGNVFFESEFGALAEIHGFFQTTKMVVEQSSVPNNQRWFFSCVASRPPSESPWAAWMGHSFCACSTVSIKVVSAVGSSYLPLGRHPAGCSPRLERTSSQRAARCS